VHPFPPYSLKKFDRIFSDDAVFPGTLKEHFEGQPPLMASQFTFTFHQRNPARGTAIVDGASDELLACAPSRKQYRMLGPRRRHPSTA